MRKFFVILLIIFSLFPLGKIKAEDLSSNVGFIPADIWYSKDPFEEGDQVKIYTLVFNHDKRELSGNVIFFDNDAFIGKKDFIVPANGVKEIYIEWTATVGSHEIFGKIENAKFLISTGKYEETYLSKNETEKSERTVSKKIVQQTTDSSDNQSTTNSNTTSNSTNNQTTSDNLIQDIQNTLTEKTPPFISKPIISITNSTEKFRENLSTSSENKKEELKNEIETINKEKEGLAPADTTKSIENQNKVIKPLKYVQIFFLTLASFILKTKVLFYLASLFIVFLILRFIWRKLF